MARRRVFPGALADHPAGEVDAWTSTRRRGAFWRIRLSRPPTAPPTAGPMRGRPRVPRSASWSAGIAAALADRRGLPDRVRARSSGAVVVRGWRAIDQRGRGRTVEWRRRDERRRAAGSSWSRSSGRSTGRASSACPPGRGSATSLARRAVRTAGRCRPGGSRAEPGRAAGDGDQIRVPSRDDARRSATAAPARRWRAPADRSRRQAHRSTSTARQPTRARHAARDRAGDGGQDPRLAGRPAVRRRRGPADPEARRRQDVREAQGPRDGALRWVGAAGSRSARSRRRWLPDRSRRVTSARRSRLATAAILLLARSPASDRSAGAAPRRRVARDSSRSGWPSSRPERRHSTAVPEGDGPWRLVVEAMGSPRDGQQSATLATAPDAAPAFTVAATLPRYPVVVPGDQVTVDGSIRPAARLAVRRLPAPDRRCRHAHVDGPWRSSRRPTAPVGVSSCSAGARRSR